MKDKSAQKTIVTTAERPDLINVAAEWIWESFWKKNGYSLDQIRALVTSSNAVLGTPQCLVLLVGRRANRHRRADRQRPRVTTRVNSVARRNVCPARCA